MRNSSREKLENLLAKLKNGKKVSQRDLLNTLGNKGLMKYELLWAKELERRKYFDVKPKLIKDYDDLIKKADFAHNKLQPNTKHPKPTKLYESAVELHRQIVNADKALEQWFDRALSKVAADVDGIARLVTSRSEFKRTNGNAEAISKEAIKRIVLTDALNKIEAEEQAFRESEDGKKLKSKLADLMKKILN